MFATVANAVMWLWTTVGVACHGANAGGPLETPTLPHQNREYLVRQLHAFKTGGRRNDIYTRMRSVAEKLTDREIEKLSTFYATTLGY